jgi:crotonobetainyl-CoA:carnitine CoA-transferase CaiB-like acyl-CoA transferase
MSGVRVVEIAQYTLVPAAGALLAEWGADVIKVEPAGLGDAQRRMVQALDLNHGDDREFLPTVEGPNRGKRSMAMTLTAPDAGGILRRLAETADVFMTNVMPATRDRLGIAAEQVHAVNPRVVYASATGYGNSGPEAGSRAFDVTAFWARSGAAYLATADDDERLAWQPVPAFGDNVAALAIAAGVSAALYQRHRTGTGTVVDVSLLAAGAWTTQYAVNLALNGDHGLRARRDWRGSPPGNPLMASYRTSDGHWVVLATAEPHRWWADLCQRLGLGQAEADRFAAPDALRAGSDDAAGLLRAAIVRLDLDTLVARMETFGAPWSVARDPLAVGTDPTLRDIGGITDVAAADGRKHSLVSGPVRFAHWHPEAPAPAPQAGQHTDAILGELGYADREIADLRRAGVIA